MQREYLIRPENIEIMLDTRNDDIKLSLEITSLEKTKKIYLQLEVVPQH